MSDGARIEVAQVVTRFIAGAGGVALRGALELDTAHYHVTVVTGARSALLDQAEAAGMDTVVEPSLVAPIAPRSDATALSRLTTLFRARGFDFDYVLYSNYERQVDDLVAGRIDVAWNSPLAWVRARRAAGAAGLHASAPVMRDTGRTNVNSRSPTRMEKPATAPKMSGKGNCSYTAATRPP